MLRTPPLLRGEHKRKIWFCFYLMERIIRNSMRIGKSGLIFTIVGMFLKTDIPPADDAAEGVKATYRTRTASAKMLLRKHKSAFVRKIIRTLSEDTPLEMFEMLQLNFFQHDTNEKTQVRTSLNMCRQGPEQDITEFIGNINDYYAQLTDMGAEVDDTDKRITLCSRMNGRFRELAKMFTTQKPDVTYQELCTNLLLADRNH